MAFIGIIGGDKRQEYMVDILKSHNVSVISYGISNQSSYHTGTLAELMKNSTLLAAPIPFTRNKKTIFSLSEKDDLDIDEFLSHLQTEHILCGGNLPEYIKTYCNQKKVPYYDFMENDYITSFNAIATAEGAIMEACRLSPLNFYKNNSLVIGFGKCGSVLADRLYGLYSHVTVCARRKESRTQAEIFGYTAISFEELKDHLKETYFIFNTVPAPVLTAEYINLLPAQAVIIDIASAPGGVDFQTAGTLGITSSLFLGIPGKTAAYSSAQLLAKELLNILSISKEN